MNNQRPPLTDARLDRLLDRWLTEGPESVVDRVPEAALLAVSTTRQKGSGGFMNRFRPDRPAARMLAGLAAVAFVVVVGFGIWQSTDVSVEPTPTPSIEPTASASAEPTPTPEPTPIALVDFSYPDLGWEVPLPTNWFDDGETNLPQPYRSFGAFGEPGGSVSVALGGADGTVQVCLAPGCVEITVTSLDQFGTGVFGSPVGPFIIGPTSSEIDGEPAQEFQVANLDNPGGANERYLLALHLGRPLFIHYHETPGVQNHPWAEIRNAFRFVDPISLAMVQTDDGYAVGVPERFTERQGTSCDGWRIFDGLGAPYGTMAISYGQPDGSFQMGFGDDSCQTSVATTLGDLRDVVSGPDPGLGPTFGDGAEIQLDGEPALLFSMTGLSSTYFPSTAPTFWVVAFHNDRPVVLQFHFTSIDRYPGLIDDIVASFRFLDP